MKKELEKKFGNFLGLTDKDATLEQFLTILNLPNEQFDLIYENFSERLDSVFAGQNFRQEVIDQLKVTPLESIEETQAEIQEFLDEIREDDTLSKKKKDLIITLIERSILEVYKINSNPREKVEVKIKKLTPDAKLPTYAHDTDAGADVYSSESVTLNPYETKLIGTGIATAIPKGYEISIRPRSGLSLKSPLRIANSPATIDSLYRGEIKIIMTNTGSSPFSIEKGDRIAQMIISPVPMIQWNEVEELDSTERGSGGFGSTGQ